MAQAEAVVIGAGLAGLSTAVYLLERGVRPIVIESLPHVGGRTASWDQDGMHIESGLHRYLGFYSHLPRMLKKCGIAIDELIHWEDEVEIRMPNGPRAVLGLAPLHKPFRTVSALVGNNHFLSPRDKGSLLKFFAGGAADFLTRPEYLDSFTVLEYAERRQVTRHAIDRLLIPLTEGVFFLQPNIYSAFALFSLFMPYWKWAHRVRVGAFMGGMTEAMAGPVADHITKQGGTVVLSDPVKRISRHVNGTFTVHTTKATVQTSVVVLASSLGPAQQIIGRSFADPSFDAMLQLQSTPAVTLQLELREPCMGIDRTTFGPYTCMASFAEQSRTTFRKSAGRLSIILSPPQAYIHRSDEAILRTVLYDASKLGIHLDDKIISYRKVVIPHDFYLLAPGAEALRPMQRTAVPGFFLAGDYTKQKFLATMEGAVYSGKSAARAAHAFMMSDAR